MIEFNLDWPTVLTFVITILLPLLVGLVTTRVTSPASKAVLLAALAFVTSILSEVLTAVVNDQPYDIGSGLVKFLGIFVIAVATYFGLWSRPGKDGQSVAGKLVDKGITANEH